MKNFFFFMMLFLNTSVHCEFAAGTLIKIPTGYSKIEDLKKGDLVVGFNFEENKSGNYAIKNVRKIMVDDAYLIRFSDQEIVTSQNQTFYSFDINEWINIKNIENMNLVVDNFNIQKFYSKIDLYQLNVATVHNFYITNQDLLVHNAVPLVVISFFASPLSAQSLMVLGSMMGAFGFLQFKDKSFKKMRFWGNKKSCSAQPDPEDPDDDKEDSFFKRIQLNADKKARTKRFGKLYRDKNTKLWWSKDLAGHGGSKYKVYKETAKGLEWLFDADTAGNPIISKHKGPIGLFIYYNEIILLP